MIWDTGDGGRCRKHKLQGWIVFHGKKNLTLFINITGSSPSIHPCLFQTEVHN